MRRSRTGIAWPPVEDGPHGAPARGGRRFVVSSVVRERRADLESWTGDRSHEIASPDKASPGATRDQASHWRAKENHRKAEGPPGCVPGGPHARCASASAFVGTTAGGDEETAGGRHRCFGPTSGNLPPRAPMPGIRRRAHGWQFVGVKTHGLAPVARHRITSRHVIGCQTKRRRVRSGNDRPPPRRRRATAAALEALSFKLEN